MSDSELVERYETMKFGEDLENENHQIGSKKEREDVRLKIYDMKYEKINI